MIYFNHADVVASSCKIFNLVLGDQKNNLYLKFLLIYYRFTVY